MLGAQQIDAGGMGQVCQVIFALFPNSSAIVSRIGDFNASGARLFQSCIMGWTCISASTRRRCTGGVTEERQHRPAQPASEPRAPVDKALAPESRVERRNWRRE
ncbi:MAG: hypothetical protein ACREOO_31470 [bacterium]